MSYLFLFISTGGTYATNSYNTSRQYRTVIIALLVITFCYLFMFPATAAETTEQAVLAAHEQRRTATIEGDAARLGSMMTDDFTFTHPNGFVENKEHFLDALKTPVS